jgi:hypothetical protein
MTNVPSTPLGVTIGNQPVLMNPKTFKSGKTGWHLSQKITILGVRYQVSFCLVRIDKSPTPEVDETVEYGGVELFVEKTPETLPEGTGGPKKGKRPSKRPKPG